MTRRRDDNFGRRAFTLVELPAVSRRERAAFTLVELPVVIGFIAVLVGVLLPALSAAREQAQRAVCASQLRQLVQASVLYLGQHRQYPSLAPLPAGGGVYPSGLDVELVNEIAGVLRLPTVDATMTVDDLPRIFHPPQRDEVDLLKTCDASFGRPVWNAGSSYEGAIKTPGQTGTTLIRARVPDRRGKRRGVLWSDHLIYVGPGCPGSGYAYYHFKEGSTFVPPLGVLENASTLRGMHRAWTDDAVKWPDENFDLAPAKADADAPYKWTLPDAAPRAKARAAERTGRCIAHFAAFNARFRSKAKPGSNGVVTGLPAGL